MIIGLHGRAGSGKDTCARMMTREHPVFQSGAWRHVGPSHDPNPLLGHGVAIGFADPIKVIAQDLYQFSDDQLWGPSAMRNAPDPRYPREHEWVVSASPGLPSVCFRCKVAATDRASSACLSLSPREACQIIGTEVGRTLYSNTWIDLAIRRADDLMRDVSLVPVGHGQTRLGRCEHVVISDVRFVNEIDQIHAFGGLVLHVSGEHSPIPAARHDHKSEAEIAAGVDRCDVVVSNHGTKAETREILRGVLRVCGV